MNILSVEQHIYTSELAEITACPLARASDCSAVPEAVGQRDVRGTTEFFTPTNKLALLYSSPFNPLLG